MKHDSPNLSNHNLSYRIVRLVADIYQNLSGSNFSDSQTDTPLCYISISYRKYSEQIIIIYYRTSASLVEYKRYQFCSPISFYTTHTHIISESLMICLKMFLPRHCTPGEPQLFESPASTIL